jgi:hypothetical protein
MCLLKKQKHEDFTNLYNNFNRIRRPPLFSEDGTQNCRGLPQPRTKILDAYLQYT